jgi:hypothetical protein
MTDSKKSTFEVLSKVKCKVEKKGRFNYVSWASAWKDVKTLYPNSNYRVIPYKSATIKDGCVAYTDKLVHPISKEGGGFVVVQVTIENLTHEEYYPILDNYNKPIKYDFINAFDINTSIKRGLAKCLALHGVGLYVFEGEDLPDK